MFFKFYLVEEVQIIDEEDGGSDEEESEVKSALKSRRPLSTKGRDAAGRNRAGSLITRVNSMQTKTPSKWKLLSRVPRQSTEGVAKFVIFKPSI